MHIGADFIVWVQLKFSQICWETWRMNFDKSSKTTVATKTSLTRIYPAIGDRNPNEEEDENVLEFEKGLDQCLELHALFEKIVKYQGNLLLVQFCCCLVQGSAAAYAGASILFVFEHDDDGSNGDGGNTLSRMMYSATFVLGFLLLTMRLNFSCGAGQDIEVELVNCRYVPYIKHELLKSQTLKVHNLIAWQWRIA